MGEIDDSKTEWFPSIWIGFFPFFWQTWKPVIAPMGIPASYKTGIHIHWLFLAVEILWVIE